MKKREKTLIIILSSIVGFVLSVGSLVLLLELVNYSDQMFVRNNIILRSVNFGSPYPQRNDIQGKPLIINNSNYNKKSLLKKINNSDNKLIYGQVFPDTLDGGKTSYFEYIVNVKNSDAGLVYARSEIYLEWTADFDSFFSEKSRIESIEYELLDNTIKKPITSENLFNFQSYLLSYNYESQFEYVIFDEDSLTIRYVYLYDIGYFDNIVFDSEFAPTRVLKNTDLKNTSAGKRGYYTIYNNNKYIYGHL